ncbi:F-box only protein 3 isoform X1 [Gallus gallus]|nr:F-box only protein 3 isoform X1 [Gallus gallus]
MVHSEASLIVCINNNHARKKKKKKKKKKQEGDRPRLHSWSEFCKISSQTIPLNPIRALGNQSALYSPQRRRVSRPQILTAISALPQYRCCPFIIVHWEHYDTELVKCGPSPDGNLRKGNSPSWGTGQRRGAAGTGGGAASGTQSGEAAGRGRYGSPPPTTERREGRPRRRSGGTSRKMAAPLDMEPPALSLELLPTDPLLLILSFLDYRDLMSCCYLSRRLNQLSSHDPLWKRHCKKYWLISDEEKIRRNQSWKAIFVSTYSDLGRYIQYYATLKKAWDDLEKYLGQRCPRMIGSLKESVQEEDLDAVEAQIGCKLPDDYRCSFRIHNGQKLVVPGLMGSMALSNHYRSEDLLDIDTAAGGFQQRLGLKQCLPLTFCIHTGLSQYMALESVEGRNKYEIFYQCPDQMARNPSAIDMFITGTSYLEWFTSYVNKVVTGGYPIIRDQIFRYVHDKECVATTGDITVSVSTSFLPELSSVHPPHYFFTYRIRIEMSKDALPEKACQLDSRYWRITNAKGDVEEVQGPGVVGEFPIISPGRVYEYTSCTTFSTTSGYMEGYYTFHCLYYKEKFFNVTIPRFHMVCPTFKVSTARMETNHNEYAVDEDEDSTDTDEYEDRRRVMDIPAPSGRCPHHT